jgi:hypothetical protein
MLLTRFSQQVSPKIERATLSIGLPFSRENAGGVTLPAVTVIAAIFPSNDFEGLSEQ